MSSKTGFEMNNILLCVCFRRFRSCVDLNLCKKYNAGLILLKCTQHLEFEANIYCI